MKVAILGDGQLARMLALACYPLGITPIIYSKNSDAPASQVASFEGDLNLLLQRSDRAIFESEFPPPGLPSGNQFFPSLESFAFFQSKLMQKMLLKELQIPTPNFLGYFKERSLEGWLGVVREKFAEPVLKWGHGGYDGYGVFTIKKDTPWEPILSFCRTILEKGGDLYAEEKIEFDREWALVSVASKSQIIFYPLVETIQQNGVCSIAKWSGDFHRLEARAQEIAKVIQQHTSIEGVFAIEFFEFENQLLVNEIAPRVHNSGHFSLDVSETSQFENHLRVLCNFTIGSTLSKPFCMGNLLGQREGVASPPKIPLAPEMHMHWYGKKQLRPGRKMGHITGHSEDDVQKYLEIWRKEA